MMFIIYNSLKVQHCGDKLDRWMDRCLDEWMDRLMDG